MQQMNRAKLILRNPVRPPEVINHRLLGRIVIRRLLAQLLKYVVDFFLGKYAVYSHPLLSAEYRLRSLRIVPMRSVPMRSVPALAKQTRTF